MRITREAFESNKFTGDLAAQVFSSGVQPAVRARDRACLVGRRRSGTRRPADEWLVEAIAQMASARALEVMKSPGDYDGSRRGWRADAKEAASRAPMPLA